LLTYLDQHEPNNNWLEEVVSIKNRRGLPIGNLTSQLFANIYLNKLDQFVKHTLKVRWYGRYMDDFLFIHPDKDYLRKIKSQIKIFLKERLGLDLHPNKVNIYNVSQGVPFVGYRIFYDYVLIKGKTLLRSQKRYHKKLKLVRLGKFPKEKLKRIENSMISHLKQADTWGLRKRLFSNN
jgi:RNA-directed DNA polymerase